MRTFIVLAALVAAAATASSAGAVTAPPVSFTDTSGDGGAAPDITGVSVTNDDHGLYTFTIKLAAPYGGSATAEIVIDSDQNPNTGDPDTGAEYDFIDDHASHTYGLYTWDATQKNWVQTTTKTTSVTVAADSMSITLQVNRSELGNTSKFDFFAVTTDGSSYDTGHADWAPDGTDWYTYAQQAVFSLTTATYHDGAAKAGGTWTVSMSAVRSDTGQVVTSGADVKCAGKEGSKALAVQSSSFTSAGAVCTFRVPKKPARATLHSTITITEAGQSVTKSFTATSH